MVLSTAQLRAEYAPACSNKTGIYIDAYTALDQCFRRHRYPVRSRDSGAYACRRITGGSGYSLHAYGPGPSFTFWTGVRFPTSLAVDINSSTNPYGPRLVTDMSRAMIDDIMQIRTNSGAQVWGWGGYYSNNKDAMHFEVVCSKRDLATGIAGEDDDDMTTPDEVRLIVADEIKKAEDRQNAWIKSQFGTAVSSIKAHTTTVRDGLAALIRRLPGAPQD